MHKHLVRLSSDALKTLKGLGRVKNIFDKRKLLPWLWSFRPEEKAVWQDWKKAGFQIRGYGKYQEYARHQATRLKTILLDWENSWLKEYDTSYRDTLRERLRPHIGTKGTSVLCLAARLGTEVKAFIDLGCFAVGLDLNPGEKNKYVLFGDFHNIQYSDESVEIVFTNAFDHVLYPDKIMNEIKRVLKANGRFVAEFSLGLEEGSTPGQYESFFWSKLEDLVQMIEDYSFKVVYRENFTIKGTKQDKVKEFFIFEKVLQELG